MAQFSWTFDVPSGTLKNHALSKKLYMASVEKTVFVDWVSPTDAFGKGKGETVTLTRIANLEEPDDISLDENMRIPEDEFGISTTSITVKEIGRSVPYTNLAEELGTFNLESSIQKKLREQLSLGLDTMAANAFKQTMVKYAVTGATSNNIANNGVFGATSTANLSYFHVESIRDYMFDTLRAPTVNGDYIGIFRTKALRGLKRDSAFEEWHKYTDPQMKANGEVGRIEGIRFIEINHAKALGNVGNAGVLGEGVVFGDDSVAMAEAMTPELRAALPDNFGRFGAVAWYGILNFGLIWDTGNPGEARILHVGSA